VTGFVLIRTEELFTVNSGNSGADSTPRPDISERAGEIMAVVDGRTVDALVKLGFKEYQAKVFCALQL
jgi:hypothetical protein